MTFPEFREIIEQKNLTTITACHKYSEQDYRFDVFLNGDGSCPFRAPNKLKSALNSINYRAVKDDVSLIGELLGAQDHMVPTFGAKNKFR